MNRNRTFKKVGSLILATALAFSTKVAEPVSVLAATGIELEDATFIADGAETTGYGKGLTKVRSYGFTNASEESIVFSNNQPFTQVFAEELKFVKNGVTAGSGDRKLFSAPAFATIQGESYMYLGISGDMGRGVIVVLKKVNGQWEKVDDLIFSGFTNSDVDATDYAEVVGKDLDTVYLNEDGSANLDYVASATNPSILEANGKLYLAYGSGNGGIYAITLDQKTGLRDLSETEVYTDPYMGTKLAGGNGVQVELTAYRMDQGYAFLYVDMPVSSGMVTKVFRGDQPLGEFYDQMNGAACVESGSKMNGYQLTQEYQLGDMETPAEDFVVTSFVTFNSSILYATTEEKNEAGNYEVDYRYCTFTSTGWPVLRPVNDGNAYYINNASVSKSDIVGSYSLYIDSKLYETNLHEDGSITGDIDGVYELTSGSPTGVAFIVDGVPVEGYFLTDTVGNIMFTLSGYNTTMFGQRVGDLRDDLDEKSSSREEETTTEEEETTTQEETTKEEETTSQEETTKEEETTSQEETTKEEETTSQEETTKEEETTTQEETTKEEETTTQEETTKEAETTSNNEEQSSGKTTEQQTTLKTDDGNSIDAVEISNTSVHDPSIVKNTETDVYYVFGSHRAWAKSTNLQTWTMFENNINKITDENAYSSVLANGFNWAKEGDSVYSPIGNMWAPDVIYNEKMGKWCMYLSVNGCSWNSSIVLLTSDSLEGDWEYAGTVIYSGFTKNTSGTHSFTKTDYTKVTGDTSLPARYQMTSYVTQDGSHNCEATTWNTSYGAHAIDPSVKYDEAGNLWMTYGSWSGGIYMIQLDGTTGLRDYNKTYSLDTNHADGNGSDPYMGIMIAGGEFVSGEASYIEKMGDYWYLFVTYGGLTSTGGYNMRVFRSKNITGPYTDERDKSAIYSAWTNNINGIVGYRIFGNYKWNAMTQGEVAQGHNSVLVDEDGKMYLVYHTRYTNRGEMHNLRVHQLFMNENDWPVASVAEYHGENLSATAYNIEEVVGYYGVILHSIPVAYASKKCNTEKFINLNADGTINGDYTGTWTLSGSKPYINLTIDGTIYQAVLVKGQITINTERQLTFTGTSKNIAIWGHRISDVKDLSGNQVITQNNSTSSNTDANVSGVKITCRVARYLGKKITLKKGKTFKIKAKAKNGETISYTSSNSKVAKITKRGIVKAVGVGKAVISVTSANGKTVKYRVTVCSKNKKVTSFQLKKTKLTIKVGKSKSLLIKKYPNGTNRFSFKSKNKKIASINKYGVVKAKKAGKTKITVKCGNKTVIVKVTVK